MSLSSEGLILIITYLKVVNSLIGGNMLQKRSLPGYDKSLKGEANKNT